MESKKPLITPNQLRNFRALAGLNLKDVAVLLGIKNYGRISEWENSLSNPSIEHLIGLSVIYQTLPDQLYFEMRKRVARKIGERHKLLKDRKGQGRELDHGG